MQMHGPNPSHKILLVSLLYMPLGLRLYSCKCLSTVDPQSDQTSLCFVEVFGTSILFSTQWFRGTTTITMDQMIVSSSTDLLWLFRFAASEAISTVSVVLAHKSISHPQHPCWCFSWMFEDALASDFHKSQSL
jgi:hypothetical protein